MISPALQRQASALSLMISREPDVVRVLPVQLVNGTNARGHWRKHSGRTKALRKAAAMAFSASGLRPLTERLVVLVTRIAPHRLDDDGAVASAKPIRDGLADYLLVDDRDERVTWLVDQRRAGVREYGCEVAVWKVA